MADDNRFAGIGDAVDDDGEPDETTRTGEGDPAPDEEAAGDAAGPGDAAGDDRTDTPSEADTEVPASTGGSDSGDGETDPADAGPAFEFDETTPKSVYVRDKTLTTLEDLEFEVESLLRREHGIRDLTGREFHDAAVRVLEDRVEDIAETVVETREREG